ncbi:MAG: TatD family hydrolase [Planctomycetota bacterium]|jgi:TatD DNase family protein
MRLFDTHCHLTWDETKNPSGPQLERARAAGVDRFVCVAIDVDNARECADLAARHEDVFPTVGIHPNDVGDAPGLPARLDALRELARQGGFIAIGETGLDFFRDWAEPDAQHASLEAHLDLASELDLPFILHCRNAIDGLLPVLRARGERLKGVMHCYSEGPAPIGELVELGLHISFAGNVTYPKSTDLREAAKLVPLNRLLIETDAPFLAPQPRRGKSNEPAFVAFTMQALAELLDQDAESLAAATHANASELFGV